MGWVADGGAREGTSLDCYAPIDPVWVCCIECFVERWVGSW